MKGESVSSIASVLRRSRKWVYHWINRYERRSSESDWFKDESKAPKNVQRSLSEEITNEILSIRKDLVQQKMAQIGALSIQYEFKRRGISPIPAVWAINRVIARNGLNKPTHARKTVKSYPELFIHTHQMDLVGPRYIKGDGHYYSLNLIDTQTHTCFVKAIRIKSSAEIVQAIAEFWSTHGMPDALQMDNELAFRGSNRYPRSFGSVVRFALSQGVAPVFIPLAEPWRNGMIEKFNNTFQKHFLNAYTWEDFNHLCAQEKEFVTFHNANHRYSTQGHKTPNEACNDHLKPIRYNGAIHLPQWKSKGKVVIPLEGGSVHYIRYIRGDGNLYLPNEVFPLIQELKYSYVVAEINIDNHVLVIHQNGEARQILPYAIPAVNW